jgi:hypothetical protein
LGGDLTLNEEHTNGCQFVLSLTLKKVTASKMKFNKKFGKKKQKVLHESSKTTLITIPEESESRLLEYSD